MEYFLILFLLTGFIIALMDIVKYYYFLYIINNFEKTVLEFKTVVSDKNIEIKKVNQLLTILLEKYQIYIKSNINAVYKYDINFKKEIFVTSCWIFEANKYLNNLSGYSFEKFLEYIDDTLKECKLSKGNNRFEVINSYIKLIPIFYFSNCFNFVFRQLSIRNEKVTQDKNRWLNFIEIISVFSGIVTIVDFFIKIFFSDF